MKLHVRPIRLHLLPPGTKLDCKAPLRVWIKVALLPGKTAQYAQSSKNEPGEKDYSAKNQEQYFSLIHFMTSFIFLS